ncbi:ecto-NOX disulfide-thiol exchanger 2-like protein, partial [Dinothrombium tinctorium]
MNGESSQQSSFSATDTVHGIASIPEVAITNDASFRDHLIENNHLTARETLDMSTANIIAGVNFAPATSQWLLSPYNTPSMTALFTLPPSSLPTYAHYPALKSTPFALSTLSIPLFKFKCCTLYPPKPNVSLPTKRERPPGCRTIFVGGIPDNATEENLKEVFSYCGEVAAVRMSKKNFCHIRYMEEESVDKALCLSGCRMKINDQDDAPNTGRLHVDFALARDDQHEYECKQRALQREMRHREKSDQYTPNPADVWYSEHEAASLIEKLKNEDLFVNAIQLLIYWLEKGECRKKNCGQFYSMLQTAHSHMRRLQSERNEFELEMQKAKQLYSSRMQSILTQFALIEKVFDVANQQKVWDHFTRAQRKNITAWKRQTKDIKMAHVEEVVNKRQEDEMDLSDGSEDCAELKRKCEFDLSNESRIKSVKTDDNFIGVENESNSDGEACESINCDKQEINAETQIELLQKTVQGLQYQLLTLRKQKIKDDCEIEHLKNIICKYEGNE